MTERKPLTITVDVGTEKIQLKLRAIATHCEALADELDVIDKLEPCRGCGSFNYSTCKVQHSDGELFSCYIECHGCGVKYHDEDLPTRLEGSD